MPLHPSENGLVGASADDLRKEALPQVLVCNWLTLRVLPTLDQPALPPLIAKTSNHVRAVGAHLKDTVDWS